MSNCNEDSIRFTCYGCHKEYEFTLCSCVVFYDEESNPIPDQEAARHQHLKEMETNPPLCPNCTRKVN